jgi:integrase
MARTRTGQVVVTKARAGRTFALRFHAYGKRRYIRLGTEDEGWNRRRAKGELENVLADVRRGIWPPICADETPEARSEPTFHEFASEWLESRRHEFAARTIEDYTLTLSRHLLPFFKDHRLSEITAQEADRYKATKVREREQHEVDRPLSNRTINKTLTRPGQILDAAARYELIPHNPVKGRVEKLKEAEPRRARLSAEQVRVLLQAAGPHRTLIATAIMAGGLRVSELTHIRWRDVDLANGLLNVAVSKTAAGIRQVVLEPELVELLREHKREAEWREPDDFVFAGRIREQPRERNSVRTKILYPAIKRADELLAADDRPPLPEGLTFHSLRHTYAALRAELGEHPAITAAQMGHRDPRMTLRVYTDVSRQRPRTRLSDLLRDHGPAQ